MRGQPRNGLLQLKSASLQPPATDGPGGDKAPGQATIRRNRTPKVHVNRDVSMARSKLTWFAPVKSFDGILNAVIMELQRTPGALAAGN